MSAKYFIAAYKLLKPITKTSMTMLDRNFQEVVGSASTLEELLKRLVDHYEQQSRYYTYTPDELDEVDPMEAEEGMKARKSLQAIRAALEVLVDDNEGWEQLLRAASKEP